MRGGKIYTALLREETAARPRIRVQFAWDQSLWRRPPKFGNKRTAVEPDICDGYYTSSLPSIALRGSARDVGLLSLRPKAGGFWTKSYQHRTGPPGLLLAGLVGWGLGKSSSVVVRCLGRVVDCGVFIAGKLLLLVTSWLVQKV